jgi:hypothetical protein
VIKFTVHRQYLALSSKKHISPSRGGKMTLMPLTQTILTVATSLANSPSVGDAAA